MIDMLNIQNLNRHKELSEMKSSLEFVINSLSTSLDLKPKQAAALLTNNNQKLLILVMKGVDGDF